MKAIIELDPKEAKALLSLVKSDGMGMSPKRLSEALKRKLQDLLEPSAAEAEPPVPTGARANTGMMRRRLSRSGG